MKDHGRTAKTIAGVIALLFGLGCLNYTTGAGIERHRAWADRAGFPAPSAAFFYAGTALACMGSGWIGFSIGTRRSAKRLGVAK